MIKPILTDRLILRQWQQEDLLPFYKLNSDPKVMEFFPKLLSLEESDDFASEIQRRLDESGCGFWAVEEKQSRKFIGFVGLNQPKVKLPFSPCVEVGWRLAKEYWGRDYATEAGKKSLEYAFETLSVNEVVSFTPVINKRSEAVMKRLGMTRTKSNFDHPKVPSDSQLYEHILYKILRVQWEKTNI